MSHALRSVVLCAAATVAAAAGLVGLVAVPAQASSLNGCTASTLIGVTSCQFVATGAIAYHAVGGGRWHIELYRGTATTPVYYRYSGGTTAAVVDDAQAGDRVVISVSAGRDGVPQRLDARDLV